MARKIDSRLQLIGTLVTASPLHVGGFGEEVDTDLPLARNGAGQLYIPGTSLAGSLRQWAEEAFGESLIDDLWGFQKDDKGHASLVILEDAVIENPDAVVLEIRDHVGIDREYGSAAESIKYDRAILPRGTKIPLRLTVEVTVSEKRNQALAMLAALKKALEAEEIRLGAAKTRGLGHVRLEQGKLAEQIYSSKQGILNAIRNANGTDVSPTDIEAARLTLPAKKRPRFKLKIAWQPIGPLMVKAGFDGIASDMLPLTSGRDGQVSLVLPGSSIKGAFRSQAERIVRTLAGIDKPDWLGDEGRKKFLTAVQVPLVDELFGKANERNANDDSDQWQPGLGALGVVDCYGKQSIPAPQWQAVQAATDDSQLQQALQSAGLEAWSQTYHVAIDRWLGSAAESMLYTVLEPHLSNWEPLSLEVNLQRLPKELQLPGLALLLLVIRDLACNRLPLGFATNRGMGSLEVTELEFEGHDLNDELKEVCKITLKNGRFENLPDAIKSEWKNWASQAQGVAS